MRAASALCGSHSSSASSLGAQDDARARAHSKLEQEVRKRQTASRSGLAYKGPGYTPLPPGYRRTQNRVPIDGVLRFGSSAIEWKMHGPPLTFAQRPLATAPSLMGQAERTLNNRYHQLLLQNRSRLAHGPGMVYAPSSHAGLPDVHVTNMESHFHADGGSPMNAPPYHSGVHYHYHYYTDAPEEGGADRCSREANDTHQGGGAEVVAGSSDVEESDRNTAQDSFKWATEGASPPAFGDDDVDKQGPAIGTEDRIESPRMSPRVAQPSTHPKMPSMLSKFLQCFDCVHEHDAEHDKRRRRLFERFDPNGNGYVSLSEVGVGVMSTLTQYGKEALSIYHRYYRSYIRAWADAKDALPARPGHPEDDDYVTFGEFRLLLEYLQIYATWLEVFARLVDVGDPTHARDALGVVHIEPDHRIAREEWVRAIGRMREAGRTWAPYVRLQQVSEADFDAIDRNAGGYIDFREFCEWLEQGEKQAETFAGEELSVNEAPGSAFPKGYKPPIYDRPPPRPFSKDAAASNQRHVGRMRAGRRHQ